MSKGKNIFDQTRAGEYENDAQKIQDLDLSSKPKIYLKREQFLSEIGKPGVIRNARTAKYATRETELGTAKITDFGQIKIAGRR